MKKNVFMVVSSNILTLMVSLFMGFIVPKCLSVDNYAYFRIYQLYVGYAGLFHLGLVNGIYLKYGHLDYEQLEIGEMKYYSCAMYVLQIIVTLGLFLLLVSLMPDDQNVAIAYAFTIINIPITNIKWFYSSINQFTRRFTIDGIVTYIQNLLLCIMVIILIVFKAYNYKFLLIFITGVNIFAMVTVMAQNKELVGVAHKGETQKNCSAFALIKEGFFFMLSEFVAIIILGIDSIFVQNLFSLNEFAMYSFAVSIISVMYSLISAVSNLIYPYLVRADDGKYAFYYTLMSDVFTVLALLVMVAFYVAKFVVRIWLLKYNDSLLIAAILFGTIVFRILIMLVGGNYFKVLKLTKQYAINNAISIVLAFVLNLIAYVWFKDYTYIAYASLLSFIIWYIITDFGFIKELHIPVKECILRYVAITLCLVIFYILFYVQDIFAAIIYFVTTLIICAICFHKQIKIILGELR